MPCRTLCLAAAACAIVAGAAAGCRRSPLGDRDAAPDQAGQGPSRGDGGTGDADLHAEAGAEAAADAARVDSEIEAPVDAAPETALDAPVDAPGDAPVDAPLDLLVDLAADVTSPDDAPDHAAGDAGDARPEDQPCGPQGFNCAPYTCDLVRGMCKTTCFSDDDCFERRPCLQGTCGRRPPQPCMANDDCNSGFCAQGTCCQTACNQVCYSCALPGSMGTCWLVPAGNADPQMRCPAGNVCDGRGQCVPSACTVAADCGRYHSCSNGHCIPCAATCVSNADCSYATCVDNNGCTICLPDAGADL